MSLEPKKRKMCSEDDGDTAKAHRSPPEGAAMSQVWDNVNIKIKEESKRLSHIEDAKYP